VPREFGEVATWCRSWKNGGQWNLGSYPSTLLESSGNHGGIAWLWYHCSLEHDEGIVRIFGHRAGVKIEIPATGSQFTSGNSPRSMAVRQQPSPGTARTTESLNESEWAEDGNHSALLNVDQRHLGAPVFREGGEGKIINPDLRSRSRRLKRCLPRSLAQPETRKAACLRIDQENETAAGLESLCQKERQPASPASVTG
jgi:hypothetical protein